MPRNSPLPTLLILSLLCTACANKSPRTTATPDKRNLNRDLAPSGAMSQSKLRSQPIRFQLDIPYAADPNPKHRLDIYTPRQPKSRKLPAIVFIHGGGWQSGDKADGAARLVPLVATGEYVGFSINYRFSDEATWPAQIHDAKAAIRWVRATARTYGVDPEKIAVWGRDSGAHLALLLGLGDVNELEGHLWPHRTVSSRVAAVVNFFGVSEMLAVPGQPSDVNRKIYDAPEVLLLGGPIADKQELAREASPITYINSGDPPVLTIHGDNDRVVPYDQAIRLHTVLIDAAVPSHFITVRRGGHGDFDDLAQERVEQFLAKYLHGRNVQISTEAIEMPGAPPDPPPPPLFNDPSGPRLPGEPAPSQDSPG